MDCSLAKTSDLSSLSQYFLRFLFLMVVYYLKLLRRDQCILIRGLLAEVEVTHGAVFQDAVTMLG